MISRCHTSDAESLFTFATMPSKSALRAVAAVLTYSSDAMVGRVSRKFRWMRVAARFVKLLFIAAIYIPVKIKATPPNDCDYRPAPA